MLFRSKFAKVTLIITKYKPYNPITNVFEGLAQQCTLEKLTAV